MTRAPRSESELSTLRKRALELASLRKERPTTVHLLAAIAGKIGPAQDLLATRNLDEESLLKAGRSFDESVAEPIDATLAHARDVAKRARGPVSTDDGTRGSISPDSKIVHLEPNALHLLVSLLSDRQLAAHRALSLTGIDTTRLRTAALSLALGVVTPRRVPTTPAKPDAAPMVRSAFTPAPAMKSMPSPQLASSQAGARGIARLGAPRVVPFSQQPNSGLKRPSTPPPSLTPAAAPTSPKPSAAPKSPVRKPSSPPTPDGPRAADAPSGQDQAPPPSEEKRPNTLRSLRATPLEPTTIVGRQDEIEHAVDTLMKHTENGVVLVGPSGVGKSAIVRALAGPLDERGRVLVAIEAGVFLASGPRGALADKLSEIFEELRSSGDRTVLFIDDVHDLLSASDDLVTELKTQLGRADVGFVSATTPDQHRKLIETDPQLARRLNAIHVDEPAEEDAFLMVEAAVAPVGKHHGVTFSPAAIASAVSFTIRYLPGRSLPEKAISTLDLAAARSKRALSPKEVLTEDDVAHALAMEVDVPPARMLERDIDRMLSLESLLAERIVGHDTSVATIAGHLRKSAAGLRGARPLGSFLLLGPTGVGKTETAKAVADVLFGSPDAMTRIDLSEYGEAHSVARLLGAPPGYVGHEAGGQLTEAVRRRAYQVILLDEVEKAHTDVLLAFLQVLDEGHLTDGRGRRVDFKNTIIFATSNLGSRDVAEALSGRAVGFSGRARPTGNLADKAITSAKKSLPIELFNRFDEVLFFAPLEPEEVRGIARRLLGGLASMLKQRDMRLDVDDRAIDVLMDSGGYQPELGARPMRRAIARLIESPIADMLIRGDLKPGMAALVGEEDGEISVDAVNRTDPSALPPPVRERTLRADLRA